MGIHFIVKPDEIRERKQRRLKNAFILVMKSIAVNNCSVELLRHYIESCLANKMVGKSVVCMFERIFRFFVCYSAGSQRVS